MIVSQIEKELVADIYINRNRIVTHANFSSSIFHGYQRLLVGQPALSSLDITSRVYGFCGGAHQQAAVMALEQISGATVPPDAHVLRSIIHAAEIVQNSIKWFYTSFAPDLADPSFKNETIYQDVLERFQSIKGTSFRKGVIGATYPISLYSSIAGNWPHAEFIVPGGVATNLDANGVAKAKNIIQDFKRKWLEPVLLDGSVDRFLEIDSWSGILNWFNESKRHADSDLGLFFRTCEAYGLDKIGAGEHRFLSFGAFWDEKRETEVNPSNYQKSTYFNSGVFSRMKYRSGDIKTLLEDLDDTANRPVEAVLEDMTSYEVGSLARMLLLGKSTKKLNDSYATTLFRDIYEQKGSSVFIRAFARSYELIVLSDFIERSFDRLNIKGDSYLPTTIADGQGYGITEAPRGSLAHIVEIERGNIKRYQILAPTIANINVGATEKKCSPLGKALKGMTIKDLENPIEIGMIARSFDACLRCTINFKKSSSQQDISQVVI